MPDVVARRLPLAHLRRSSERSQQQGERVAQAWSGGLMLTELPALGLIDVRARDAVQAAALLSAATGLLPPREPATFTETGNAHPSPNSAFIRWLWMGPDEWLLCVPRDREQGACAQVREALAGRSHATVIVSASYARLQVTGPGAADLLARGCALDLHPRVFLPHTYALTQLAKAHVGLLRTPDDGFELLVRPSLAEYLWQWLCDAAGLMHSALAAPRA